MKQLIFINGTMGVGKSTVCEQLYKLLPNSVWLDGDWCWMMHPWRVTEENKAMVEDNIVHLLGSFLRNSSFQHVIFCWVMHQEEIAESLLARLAPQYSFQLHRFSLLCSPDALRDRLTARGTPQQLENAAARLPLYQRQHTCPVDTTELSPEQVAELIALKVLNAGAESEFDESRNH